MVVGKGQFGICYQDFNGIPNYDVLERLSHQPCYGKMDILFNCSRTAMSRVRGLLKNSRYNVTCETRYPEDGIINIDKNYWQVREDALGRQGWQMWLGTNWNAAPKFTALGFTTFKGEK